MITYNKEHIPLYLTFVRLTLSPTLLPFLLVYFLPYDIWWVNALLAFVFFLFGLTDFFDGYFARKFNQESQLGRILDPIADKFLIYSTLIALLDVGKIYFFWVILFIGREFFVMGLRLVAQSYHIVIHVSHWGKAKTVSQIILSIILIVNPYRSLSFEQAPRWTTIEWLALSGTLLLSLVSAMIYYYAFMDQLSQNADLYSDNKEE